MSRLIMLFLAGCCFPAPSRTEPPSPVVVEEAPSLPSPPVLLAPPAAPREKWRWIESKDPMTDARSITSFLDSENALNFDFPYNGAQHPALYLRNKGGSKDVFIALEKGQVLCRSYDPCQVSVRFDDLPRMTFQGVGAADNSTETVFLNSGASRFITALGSAKKVLISFPVYQEGSPVLTYDVTGWDAARFSGK